MKKEKIHDQIHRRLTTGGAAYFIPALPIEFFKNVMQYTEQKTHKLSALIAYDDAMDMVLTMIKTGTYNLDTLRVDLELVETMVFEFKPSVPAALSLE